MIATNLKFWITAGVLWFSTSVFAQNKSANYIQFTYWNVNNFGAGTFKVKRKINMDNDKSVEQILYVIPSGAVDTTIQRDKRELVTDEKGQQINKLTLYDGPRKAFTPTENIFHFYKTNNFKAISSVTGVPHSQNSYILEDKNIDFGWKITEERKKIAEFECIKAVSKPFRGRTYTAWFAPEIPISNGPWKLGGLPGLILEANDEKSEVRFIFESIIINPENRPEIQDPYKDSYFERVDWEKYKQRTKEARQRLFKSQEAKGVKSEGYKAVTLEMID